MSGYWDIHNHLLPGLDDGSSCFQETLELLQTEYDQGIRNIIFTPHYRAGMFQISEEDRINVYKQTKELFHSTCEESMPDLQLYMGCELHMHPRKLDLYEKRIFRMPGNRVVLTEFAYEDTYSTIKEIIRPILEKGYRCIIAHAERYSMKDAEIGQLHDMPGVFIQVNAGSLLGREGFRQKLFTRKLLDKGYIDLIASDAHTIKGRPAELGICGDWIRKKYGEEKNQELLVKNPEKLFLTT